MDRDDDDFVVRHRADDLDDVLGVLRGKAGGWLVKEVNVGRADHVEPDVEPFPFAAAERFFHRAADDCSRAARSGRARPIWLRAGG